MHLDQAAGWQRWQAGAVELPGSLEVQVARRWHAEAHWRRSSGRTSGCAAARLTGKEVGTGGCKGTKDQKLGFRERQGSPNNICTTDGF